MHHHFCHERARSLSKFKISVVSSGATNSPFLLNTDEDDIWTQYYVTAKTQSHLRNPIPIHTNDIFARTGEVSRENQPTSSRPYNYTVSQENLPELPRQPADSHEYTVYMFRLIDLRILYPQAPFTQFPLR